MADSTLFSMFRGDDHALRITLEDKDNNRIPMVGWTLRATMKLHTEMPDDEAPVAVDIGPLEGPLAEVGVVEFILPHEQTKELLPANYEFDVQKELDGRVTTLLRGTVEVLADVTLREP